MEETMENDAKVMKCGIFIRVNTEHIKRAIIAMRGTDCEASGPLARCGGIDGVIVAGGILAMIGAFDRRIPSGTDALFNLFETAFGQDYFRDLACSNYGLVDVSGQTSELTKVEPELIIDEKRLLLDVEEKFANLAF
jgi:hypothetical protein